MSTKACRAPGRINSCAVMKKPTLGKIRVESHPGAVEVGFADVKAIELIGCYLDMKLKAFDAFSNLKAIISSEDSC